MKAPSFSPLHQKNSNEGGGGGTGTTPLIQSPPDVLVGIMKNNAIRHHQRVASF